LGESQAVRRKRIEIRGLNLGTIAADVRESEVVDHDDDDVWPVLTLSTGWRGCCGPSCGSDYGQHACNNPLFHLFHLFHLFFTLISKLIFLPDFYPANKQRLFNCGQFGLTPPLNIYLNRFCVVTHQNRTSSLLNSLLTKYCILLYASPIFGLLNWKNTLICHLHVLFIDFKNINSNIVDLKLFICRTTQVNYIF